MLGSMKIVGFVPARDPKTARRFYEDVLGLRLLGEDQSALEFDANGIVVRVTNVSNVAGFTPAPFTILGWQVPDAAEVVRVLQGKGVQFERFPGMQQDDLGIWTAPNGAKVAWFKDPDGNVLSVTER